MLLLNWGWIGIAAIALVAGFVGGCEHERGAFDRYKSGVEATAEAQSEEVKKTVKKQEEVAQEIKSDYEKRIADIRRYYRGLYNNGSDTMRAAGQAPGRVDATTSYYVLAESCAETTQQLVSLQDFIKETQ